MTIQELIQSRFSGKINNEAEYIELIVQSITVLIFGLVMWRLMMVWHKRKKSKRAVSAIEENRFSNKWRN